MVVNASLIRDFWPRYMKRTIIQVILMQVVITAIVGLALLLSGFTLVSVGFLAIIVAVLATTIGANIVLLVTVIMVPFKDLVAALTHVSGEPTQLHPPNPNAREYEREGFTPLLQLVYKLATLDTAPPSSQPTSSNGLLDSALEHSSASVILMNTHGEIAYASKQAPVRKNESGAYELDLLFEEDAGFAAWLQDSSKRKVHSHKDWLRVADKIVGSEGRRLFDISASFEKNNPAEVVLVLFDRTGLYQPEDDQLDFISFAAHELRGPITVIRGYLDVLQTELQSGEVSQSDRQALLERLIVSANRLSGYINNILNASRFDRRHLKVNLTEQKLPTIYDSVRDDMALRALTQNRLLSVDIPDDLPTIAADPSSLSEVFSNLVDNAIKYSSEGGSVAVHATLDGGMVKISVTDNGIGMPANVVGNLFHKFYRSHRSRETVAGTGIGLYICKAIVESHGGHIDVRSEEGRGSIFSFSIPTYASVAKNIQEHNNTNTGLVRSGSDGWIKNHAKFRG